MLLLFEFEPGIYYGVLVEIIYLDFRMQIR